ncbi:MAG: NAD(P)-dependent oxidoreductase [Pseudomonadota bacterium]
MRILFTGGAGKAGRHVVPHLMAEGHTVLNADLVPLEAPGVHNVRIDLTDAGQVFSTMQAYADFSELNAGTGMPGFDVVVHFAAIARILIAPDNETYRVNVLSTYNVIDAALRMGVKKIIFASSETVYGFCFADGARLPEYLPVDEAHPTLPMDTYGMSKVVNEATARSFQTRTGADIYGLRISEVMEPEDYPRLFPAYVKDPSLRKRNNFSYIDVRDLAGAVSRALATDGLGYEVFNIASPDSSVAIETKEAAERFYPGIPITRSLDTYEALYSSKKAEDLLAWRPRHTWRSAL